MATRLSQPQPHAKKQNTGLAVTIAVLGVLLFFIPILIGLYTDFLWFGELDFRGVFNRVIVARVVLFVIFAAVGALITYLAAWCAWRGRTKEALSFEAVVGDTRTKVNLQQGVRTLLVWVPVVVAIFSLSLIHI